MDVVILALFCLPGLLITIDFIKYLYNGTRLYPKLISKSLEIITIIGLPLFYLIIYDEKKNDCCSNSATFSPEHKLSFYVLAMLCVVFYFFSSNKLKLLSPIIEVVTNVFLVCGIVLNVIIAIQIMESDFTWLLGNFPILLLFVLQLIKNQKLVAMQFETNDLTTRNTIEKLAIKVLKLDAIYKYPVLLILLLPILLLISAFLLLFGQKPDSMIRVFTDTYKHGFSQLDYQCENVMCGGHFLCSVAANGHHSIVKPQRFGERGGHKIICNRQLLIANAFEDLLEKKAPLLHNAIRKKYNVVGNLIHKYYGIFNNKFVSDTIYVFMKPLEWIFLLVLYTCDEKPENRISKQYLSKVDKSALERVL